MNFTLNQEFCYQGLKGIFDLCSSQEKSYVRPLLRLYESSFRNLLFHRSFCFWKYESNTKRTKLSKVPYFYRDSKFVKADIRNSMDWLAGSQVADIMLSDILKNYQQEGCLISYMNGIGIILTDSPFFAIDLDHCINPIDGSLTDIAQSVVEQFKDTYIEISPSGQGLHIFGIGSLRLNGKSKSPKYPNVEAYDGSSVRYMTFTGHRLFETEQGFCNYKTSLQEVVQWFEETFFPQPVHPQLVHPHSVVTSEHQALEGESIRPLQNHGGDFHKDFEAVMKRIHESKDRIVFSKLIQQMRLSKSPSEDDLIFCSIIVTHTQDYDLDLQRTLVMKMLLRFRYRSKLKRHDYLDRTFKKARSLLKKKNSLLQKQHSSELFISSKDHQIPAEHILRIDPLVHSIFNLTHTKKDQVLDAQIRQDSDNYVVVSSPETLDVIDLSVYLSVLILLKKQLAQSQESVAFSPADYWYFTVELKEFSEIMRQCNNNHFCNKVLSSIQRLANVKIQYQKTLKKRTIKGGNSLLSWAYAQHGGNYLRLGVNYFVCAVLLGASKNYRLLNTEVFFQLSSSPCRWLYHFIVNKVFPGQRNPFKISIEELTHLMRGLLGKESKVTERTRKSKVRQMC